MLSLPQQTRRQLLFPNKIIFVLFSFFIFIFIFSFCCVCVVFVVVMSSVGLLFIFRFSIFVFQFSFSFCLRCVVRLCLSFLFVVPRPDIRRCICRITNSWWHTYGNTRSVNTLRSQNEQQKQHFPGNVWFPSQFPFQFRDGGIVWILWIGDSGWLCGSKRWVALCQSVGWRLSRAHASKHREDRK